MSLISGRKARGGGDRDRGAAPPGKSAGTISRARRTALRALPVAAAASMVALGGARRARRGRPHPPGYAKTRPWAPRC